jgi:glycosyltransferase involved in cell wall biosynthesis
MKVLLVAPQPFYQERGTPIAVRLLVEQLASFGHEIDLLVYHEGIDVPLPGVRIIRAGRPPGVRKVPIGISWQKLLCDVWLIAKMLKLLRTGGYDVIHAVEEAVFPAAIFAGRRKVRLVYDMDSSLSDQLTDKWRVLRPVRLVMEWIERLTVRRAALVLAVCEDLAVKVRPHAGAQRVVVLPDVPMGDTEAPAGTIESLRALAAPDAVIGLYVGNLERYQGIDLLLQAMASVPSGSPLSMVIIGGTGAHVEQYRRKVEEMGLSQRVHLLGARPVGHLGAYLRQADVLVSPRTLGQNTPMKVYSYMQSGKAILATDIRSHTQAMDGDCAMLVPASAAPMAKGLVRLAADAALRERLGAAARHKADTEYSLPVFRAKLKAAYEGLQAS